MATVTSWDVNIADLGAVYPMVGTEWLLVIIGVAFWIAWHVIQARIENKSYEEEVKRFGDPETLKKFVGREDPRNP